MNPKALNLFLEANGFTVTGNTDKYYRLSTNGIKEWSVNIPRPSTEDLAPYEIEAAKLAEPSYREKRALDYINELGQEPGFNNAVGDGIDAIIDHLNGDSTKLNAYTAKRDEIKQRHPK